MGPIMGHTMHYRRMIITLQPGYSIPPLIEKITSIKILNKTTLIQHFYPDPSTRNGAVDSQVKSNPRKHFLDGKNLMQI